MNWRSLPRWSYVLLAVVALAGVAAALLYVRGETVDVATVGKAPLRQTVVVSGRVLAPAKVGVGSTITGRVEKVAVDDGDRIAVGQVLVALERAELAAALSQARANEAAAATRIRQWTDVDATNAQQQSAQAESNLRVAERNASRQEQLFKQGFIGEAAVDEARRALDVARSQAAAARANASASAPAGSGRRLVEDQLNVARAARDTAAAKLEQTRIVAPAAGVVLDRNVEPGDIVQPGKTLLTLALDGPARLTALIDEKNLALLKVGQQARVSADAYPSEHFDAELEYVSPGVDVQRGTVEAKFRIARPPPFLRSDMTVSIDIGVADKPDAIVIPAGAVRDPQSPEPWVLVAEGGHAVRRAVQTGARTASVVEIVRGLDPGERVIVTPLVRAGARVWAR
jgi:HlyD family secretion protein